MQRPTVAVALSRRQAREIDRLAIEHVGIPSVVLMENAGINATAVILDTLADDCEVDPDEARVAVICGGGNNGGDGYVVARHLHNWGVAVTLFPAVDPADLKGDAATNYRICGNLGLDIRPVLDAPAIDAAAESWDKQHIVVDAMLGTGFSGEVRPHLAAVIRRVNTLRTPLVVALDVPSGLDCERGRPSETTLRADMTVTFIEDKLAFHHPESLEFVGRVVVADIGVPVQLVQRVISGK
jgi:NAD(P)H-hydrate epimerase